MPKAVGFTVTKMCDECPWRRDVSVGRFSPERFRALRRSAEQGFGKPIFACHKSKEEEPFACVGFLLVEGDRNFAVRIAVIDGRLDYSKLEATGPLYESIDEMSRANGDVPYGEEP